MIPCQQGAHSAERIFSSFRGVGSSSRMTNSGRPKVLSRAGDHILLDLLNFIRAFNPSYQTELISNICIFACTSSTFGLLQVLSAVQMWENKANVICQNDSNHQYLCLQAALRPQIWQIRSHGWELLCCRKNHVFLFLSSIPQQSQCCICGSQDCIQPCQTCTRAGMMQ